MTRLVPAPYIVLYHGVSRISALIRWQTRSEYSHAALCLYTREGMRIVEAIEGQGVLCRQPTDADLAADWFRVRAPKLPVMTWPEARYQHAAAFALEQVGKGYDWTSVLRFVSRRQARREAAGVWFCSELVFAAYQQAGIELLRAVEPWEVSPGLLARSPYLVAADHPTTPHNPLIWSPATA